MSARRVGALGRDNCPRCGASPSQQKYRPRNRVVDISEIEHIDTFHPADAVCCHECGMAFMVTKLEFDDPYVIDWYTKYDYVPNYCPQCGAPIVLNLGG